MTIVLLSGKQGSGKSTTSAALDTMAAASGKFYFIFHLKFAGPLYVLQDLVLNKMEQFTGKPRVRKDGTLLQLLGTEWGRKNYGEDVWVNALKAQIEETVKGYRPDKTLVIVDDCRFKNEFDAFPGALRVRLNAKEEVRKARADAWREDTLHPSEMGLDIYDLEGKFDLYLQTDLEVSNPEHCATLIIAKLVKENWVEKRLNP